MASEYSSSITMVERLLTRRGPAEPVANSSILLSTSWTLVSPVSVRRMLAMVMVVPSVSLPPMAARAPSISGTLRRESISAWVADAASTPPRASITNVGAMIGSAGASSSATPGLARMLSRRASIWASPPGVSASPRNTSVTTLTSPDSPKNSSSSSTAVAMALPGGRNATEAPSTGGRRRVAPAASMTVTSSRTMIVMYGRAVTSRLNLNGRAGGSWRVTVPSGRRPLRQGASSRSRPGGGARGGARTCSSPSGAGRRRPN